MPAPQLYAIRAVDAPVAVVIARRGDWVHLARWDLKTCKVAHGAWFRGRLYQRRCDISPDGAFFYFFAMKGGRPFHAVSRVPWLTALALWRDNTTYGGGQHFEPSRRSAKVHEPDEGTIAPLAKLHGWRLVGNEPDPYAAERQRGWLAHPQAQVRAESDVWHEKVHQWLYRDQPGGSSRLELRDHGYVRGRFEGRVPHYVLDGNPLEDVTWADWDPHGQLLVATRAGCLEIRSSTNKVKSAVSLAAIEPDPAPSPSRARAW